MLPGWWYGVYMTTTTDTNTGSLIEAMIEEARDLIATWGRDSITFYVDPNIDGIAWRADDDGQEHTGGIGPDAANPEQAQEWLAAITDGTATHDEDGDLILDPDEMPCEECEDVAIHEAEQPPLCQACLDALPEPDYEFMWATRYE